MNLFTKTEIGENPVKIHLKGRILTLGSCFAENIGQKLVENKFITLCNPFGIVYNPISISSCIDRIVHKGYIKTKELQLCQDYYCHMDFHSQFNTIDKQTTFEAINKAIESTFSFVDQGLDWLIVSLGTAYAYKHLESNQIVNNCHKFPSNKFERFLLDTDQILSSLSHSIQKLSIQNPDLKVIITVSPIRHIRDGLKANLRSKSRLIEAAHLLSEKVDQCFYFPAYEILIEELRDYRWYKEDLIHPNDQAVEYVWQQFMSFAFDEESKVLTKKMTALIKNLNHKAFLAESSQYKSFLDHTAKKIQELEKEYEHLSFEKEKAKLQLNKQG